MIPRFSPDYHLNDLATALLPAGPSAIRKVEAIFRARTGHAEAVPFRYGRSGLYYLLKALGVKNKKVIFPSYTCVVVANAVSLSGNIPVFLDNASPENFQPDPQSYLDAIDADTCMIVPTHIFGVSEETKSLYDEVKRKHPNVFVLQDCAHGFFCTDSTGQPAAHYGDGALFGMNISKLVNSVKGGMLTLRDEKLAAEVRRKHCADSDRPPFDWKQSLISRVYVWLAAFGFTRFGYEIIDALIRHTKLLSAETDYYRPDTIDLPADFRGHMQPVEAAIGVNSLKRYDRRVALRREIAQFYLRSLAGLPGLTLPRNSLGNSWNHFPVMVDSASARDALREKLRQAGRSEIGIIVDYSVADLPAFRGATPCPVAASHAARVINLPLTLGEGFFGLSRWEPRAARLVECLREPTIAGIGAPVYA